MPTVEQDYDFLRASAPELKDYLLSDQLFWPLGAGEITRAPLPRLTLGGLLLALERLRTRELAPEIEQQVGKWQLHIESVRDEWLSAWERKAAREFTSRLHQWRNYLEEYRRKPEDHADYYPQEVERRALLEILDNECPEIEDGDRQMLRLLDDLLRSALRPDGFVWDPEVRSAFPESQYWYLYGELRE